MKKAEEKTVVIMLIEDNPGDVLLTEEAFFKAKIRNNIIVAKDGEEAIKILKNEQGYELSQRPDIILLDLNLPKVDGRQVLEFIKKDNDLKKIPTVILTSSEAEKDIINTYNLHANSYIIKPVDMNKFTEIVSAIENFGSKL